jgi:hypothetical protein
VVLDDSNILQVDATVIAGSLVLLTILYTLLPKSSQEVPGDKASFAASDIARVIRIIVIFFSASAVLVILGNVFGSYSVILAVLAKYANLFTLTNLGKYAMVLGFGALAIGIIWLVKPIIKSWSYMRKG